MPTSRSALPLAAFIVGTLISPVVTAQFGCETAFEVGVLGLACLPLTESLADRLKMRTCIMRITTWLAAAAVAMTMAGAAHAQTLLDGNSLDDLLNIARGYGAADYEKQNNGDPMIRGKLDGLPYLILFHNCKDNKNCEDLNFYAGFTGLDPNPTLEKLNEWNRDNYYIKAYIDKENDPVMEMDVNLASGIIKGNLESYFEVWKYMMTKYTDFIGFKR